MIELYATFKTGGQWLGAIEISYGEDFDKTLSIPMLVVCQVVEAGGGVPSHLIPLKDLHDDV